MRGMSSGPSVRCADPVHPLGRYPRKNLRFEIGSARHRVSPFSCTDQRRGRSTAEYQPGARRRLLATPHAISTCTAGSHRSARLNGDLRLELLHLPRSAALPARAPILAIGPPSRCRLPCGRSPAMEPQTRRAAAEAQAGTADARGSYRHSYPVQQDCVTSRPTDSNKNKETIMSFRTWLLTSTSIGLLALAP